MKDEQQHDPAPPPGPPGARKLPYERPAVISEEVFETLALSCASGRLTCPPGNPDRS